MTGGGGEGRGGEVEVGEEREVRVKERRAGEESKGENMERWMIVDRGKLRCVWCVFECVIECLKE